MNITKETNTFVINTVKDLVEFINELSLRTENYLNDKDMTLEDYSSIKLIINNNLVLNTKASKTISNKLTYFKGVVKANNKTISAESLLGGSLFSSVYNSEINDLVIENTSNHRGFMLASHLNDTVLNNCHVNGSVIISKSYGGFALRAMKCIFNNCTVRMNTETYRDLVRIEDSESGEAVFVGGFVGYASKETKFNNCEVSGYINSEVGVGGFVGISKNVEFNNCDVIDLKIRALREGASFIGRSEGLVKLNNCDIIESTIDSAIYGGTIVGKSFGDILLKDVGISMVILSSESVSSFTGGIAGYAKYIEIKNCDLSFDIVSNFCVAGVCPDLGEVDIIDSRIATNITALGYAPMVVLVNEITMLDYQSSFGKIAEINICDNSNISSNITDLSQGGYVNPFEEDY